MNLTTIITKYLSTKPNAMARYHEIATHCMNGHRASPAQVSDTVLAMMRNNSIATTQQLDFKLT
jgi:hypothetical protein